MKTFSEETRKLALDMSHGYCQCSPGCVEPVTEFHHKCSNTKVNQILYPIFLQSIFNCCPINHGCHMSKPVPKVTTYEASVYEEYLESLILGKNNAKV